MLAKHVARDTEQVGAEARVPHLVSPLHAASERGLHEVVQVAADLVAKEAINRHEVRAHQSFAGLGISTSPRREQLGVIGHERMLA